MNLRFCCPLLDDRASLLAAPELTTVCYWPQPASVSYRGFYHGCERFYREPLWPAHRAGL